MSLTFRGTSLQTANIWLDVVRGYNEPADVDGKDDVIPQASGMEQGLWTRRSRRITFEGWVEGTGATELLRQQSWRTATDALKSLMDHTLAPGAVVLGAPDHGITGTKTINAKCLNAMPGPIQNTWTFQRWSFELVSIGSPPEWV